MTSVFMALCALRKNLAVLWAWGVNTRPVFLINTSRVTSYTQLCTHSAGVPSAPSLPPLGHGRWESPPAALALRLLQGRRDPDAPRPVQMLELLQLCRAHMSALVHGSELAPAVSLGQWQASSGHSLCGGLRLVQANR